MLGALYRSLRLKTKLSLLLVASTILVSAVAGLYFDHFLRENFSKAAQQRIDYAFRRFSLHLGSVERDLKKGISFIKDEEGVLASVELINMYQDKGDYDTVLLDEEKKRLAEELLNRVKLSLNNDIALYDANEELIACVTLTPRGYYLSYVSFENARPVFYSRYENESDYTRRSSVANPLLPYKHLSYYSQKDSGAGTITYHRRQDDLVIKSHQSLFESGGKRIIAHIEMSNYVSAPYFKALSDDLGMEISSRSALSPKHPPLLKEGALINEEKGRFVGVRGVKTRNGAVAILAALDKSALQATLNENRGTFLILMVVLTLLTLLVLRFLFKKGIAQPLHSLMEQIQKIERQDYSDTRIIRTGDELETISRNVQRLASTIQEREAALIASHKQLEYLSNTDPLTALPNRRFFSTMLQHGIDLAERNGSLLGVIFLDLDQFKQINDTLGHDVGDLLLQEVARRLESALRSSDTLARIGGDEFNILVEGFSGRASIEPIVEKVLKSFHSPFVCKEHEIWTTASIGVALFPEDGRTTQDLIKNADLAMYRSKDTGRNRYSFFSHDLADMIEGRSRHIHALKSALEKGDEFFLVYQPKVSAASGEITAIEALVRWNSKDLGFVTPERFIPLAEETGLILPLGGWILKQACSDFMQLRSEGYRFEQMGVNVSALQLQHGDFLQTLQEAMEQTRMDPAWLEIELTESYLATDAEHALSILQNIRSKGVRIAIDDFGTGYSSLSYLQKLPVTRLKIDKSFIDDLPDSAESTAIARAIIALANTFGLSITAEGVETRDQLAFLQEEGCHEIQGYYYSKPLGLNELRAFVNEYGRLRQPPL